MRIETGQIHRARWAKKILNRARRGLHTRIIKVKAHTGIHGNEMADQLAKEATDHEQFAPHGTVFIGQNAYEGLSWPCMAPKEKDSSTAQDTEGDASDDASEPRYVANLTTAVKTMAAERLQTGRTNNTLYHTLWQKVTPFMDGHASNAFWTMPEITPAATRQLLKVRYGQIWTMRKAFLYRMPYFRGGRIPNNTICPLACCSHPDSASHMLGECEEEGIKAMCIERHNVSLRMVLTEVAKGNHGNRLVYIDAGAEDKVRHLQCPNSTIPQEVISDRTLLDHGMAQAAERRLLRPDALIIATNEVHVPATGKRNANRRRLPTRMVPNKGKDPPFRKCKAYIIEVGYAAETRYEAKVQEKIEQHEKLRILLEAEGFEVVLQPIILGTTGGIFRSQNDLLDQLGVPKQRQQKLNRRLHIHSIQYMHSIIKARRLKESTMQGHHAARIKKPPDK